MGDLNHKTQPQRTSSQAEIADPDAPESLDVVRACQQSPGRKKEKYENKEDQKGFKVSTHQDRPIPNPWHAVNGVRGKKTVGTLCLVTDCLSPCVTLFLAASQSPTRNVGGWFETFSTLERTRSDLCSVCSERRVAGFEQPGQSPALQRPV